MKTIRSAPRRGFTLSEMLVVLGILVVVTALVQPAIRGTLGDSRLRSAGKMVRVELAKARLKAVQSGVAQRFKYQVGKNRFVVAPANLADEQSSHASAASQDSASSARVRMTATLDAVVHEEKPGDKPVEQSLPRGVCFGEEELADPAEAIVMDDEGWSPPIVFYPNGRTENARIRLKGERNAVVDVSLRGLTGMATASRPRHDEEVR